MRAYRIFIRLSFENTLSVNAHPSLKCSGPREGLLTSLLLKRGSTLRSDQAEIHDKKVSEQGDQTDQRRDSCGSLKISLAPTVTSKSVTAFYSGGIVAFRHCLYRYLRTTFHFSRKIITTRTAKLRHLKTEWWLFQ